MGLSQWTRKIPKYGLRNISGNKHINVRISLKIFKQLSGYIIYSWVNNAVRQCNSGAHKIRQAEDCQSVLWLLLLPVRTEVNGCKGSKGHFNLPDSTELDSSWNTPSWETMMIVTLNFHKVKCNTPELVSANIHSYLLHLSGSSDFNESTVGVEGSRPTGIEMCPVVVVEHPYKVSTLQLGQAGAIRAGIDF